MTVAALLVVFVAAGFYAGIKWKVSKVYIAKDSGQPLYFFSALIAIVLFVFALAADHLASGFEVYASIGSVTMHTLSPLVDAGELQRSVSFSLLGGWAVLFSLLIPWILNWPLKSNAVLLDQLAERYGEREAIDDVVRDVLKLQIPLAVTLDDSKVYVGYPISGEPFGVASKRWFRLRPMFSGWRDASRELQLTTDYQAVIAHFSSDGQASVAERAFDVVVPFDRIVSVHPLDLESYRNYFSGSEWGQEDQMRRLAELNDLAIGSEPDPLHRRDYWAFVSLLLLAPLAAIFDVTFLAIVLLMFGMAVGVQSAYPIAPKEQE